jgi:acetyl-CoA carboxylase biotin carboxyl carrier protein
LTFEQIKELIELVDQRGLAGLEIERSGFRLRIDGPGQVVAGPVVASVSAPQLGTVSAPQAPAALAPAPSQPAPEAPASTAREGVPSDLPDDAHVVKSPIVGTFYAAPSPDESPYVKVGDRVEAGQVLCIVEAMKLMNEIEADAAGVILAIYPKNAQPVEFGEPLFAVGKG